MSGYRFWVEGGTGANCAAQVQQTLAALPEVQRLELKLTADEQVWVVLEAPPSLLPQAIEAAVRQTAAESGQRYRVRWAETPSEGGEAEAAQPELLAWDEAQGFACDWTTGQCSP